MLIFVLIYLFLLFLALSPPPSILSFPSEIHLLIFYIFFSNFTSLFIIFLHNPILFLPIPIFFFLVPPLQLSPLATLSHNNSWQVLKINDAIARSGLFHKFTAFKTLIRVSELWKSGSCSRIVYFVLFVLFLSSIIISPPELLFSPTYGWFWFPSFLYLIFTTLLSCFSSEILTDSKMILVSFFSFLSCLSSICLSFFSSSFQIPKTLLCS